MHSEEELNNHYKVRAARQTDALFLAHCILAVERATCLASFLDVLYEDAALDCLAACFEKRNASFYCFDSWIVAERSDGKLLGGCGCNPAGLRSIEPALQIMHDHAKQYFQLDDDTLKLRFARVDAAVSCWPTDYPANTWCIGLSLSHFPKLLLRLFPKSIFLLCPRRAVTELRMPLSRPPFGSGTCRVMRQRRAASLLATRLRAAFSNDAALLSRKRFKFPVSLSSTTLRGCGLSGEVSRRKSSPSDLHV